MAVQDGPRGLMAKRRPQTIVDLEAIWRERLALEASRKKPLLDATEGTARCGLVSEPKPAGLFARCCWFHRSLQPSLDALIVAPTP